MESLPGVRFLKPAVEVGLRHEPIVEGTQNKANQLLRIVLENLFQVTPLAKPSTYAKRWWTHATQAAVSGLITC